MAYLVVHKSGNNESNYPPDKLDKLLSELDGVADVEAYVALTHESEWSLSINPFGLLVWENNFGELDDSWHMENVEKKQVLKLWRLLAEGKVDEIQNEQWIKGDPLYGI